MYFEPRISHATPFYLGPKDLTVVAEGYSRPQKLGKSTPFRDIFFYFRMLLCIAEPWNCNFQSKARIRMVTKPQLTGQTERLDVEIGGPGEGWRK